MRTYWIKYFMQYLLRFFYFIFICLIFIFFNVSRGYCGSLTGPPQLDKKVLQKKENRKRVNIWPLYYYENKKDKGTTEMNFLGPFFTYKEDRKTKESGFSPLYYKIEDKKSGTKTTDFIYPLGKSKIRDGEKDIRLSPLLSSKKRENESFTLFPLYTGKTAKGEGYGGIFPLYGTVKERFGMDEGRFFLWPLYSSSTKDNVKTTNFLWPIFSFSKAKGQEKFQIWPFYSRKKKEGYYDKKFVLWPLFFSEETGLNTDNPTKTKMFFPLYLSIESPQMTSKTFLWPIFSHTINKAKGFENHSVFPIFSKTVATTEGSEREGFRIFPIFGKRKAEGYKKSFFLAPLYWSEVQEGTNYQETTKRWFFINKSETKLWTNKGESEKEIHFWPAFNYRKKRDDSSKLFFPYLFLLQDEGFERNFPFLILYHYEKDKEGTASWDLLWRFMSGERSDRGSRFEISYLIDYEKDRKDDRVDVSFLKGLVSYSNYSEKKYLSFFYLPFGFAWQGSGSD